MKFLTSKVITASISISILSLSASLANAKPNLTGEFPQVFVFEGIQFSQASVDSLSESDLRRLNFYTSRALDALAALAAEDESAGTDGAAISGDTVGDLREAVKRLIDAGTRSGLSQDDVADFFYLAVVERFAQDIPLALQDASGEIDTRSLFAGVVGRTNFSEEREVDVDYLALLNQESADLDLGITDEEAEVVTEDATPEEPQGPVIRDGADAATRAVVNRVVVDGDTWTIRVISGDSLATFASAIYGDSLAYRQIFAANRSVLSNANSISIGQVLVIPKP